MTWPFRESPRRCREGLDLGVDLKVSERRNGELKVVVGSEGYGRQVKPGIWSACSLLHRLAVHRAGEVMSAVCIVFATALLDYAIIG